MILLPLLALAVGFLVVYVARLSVPLALADYVSVALLAGLDSVFGGMRAGLADRFDSWIFVSGFFLNAMLAALFVYAGDRLGVNLYLPVVVALGVRIFYNLGIIRRSGMERLAGRKVHAEEIYGPADSFRRPPPP
jgi:small basic protein